MRGGVVPFVGAGLSVPFGYPAWIGFLKDVVEKCSERNRPEFRRLVEARKYGEAAEGIKRDLTPQRFNKIIRETYGEVVSEKVDLGGQAIGLVPKLAHGGPIFTTNLDGLIEQLFHAQGKDLGPVFRGSIQLESL